MELDELKSLINQKLTTADAGRSGNDIAQILTRRTGSVIDKLKRSLWIEIFSCIGAILLFAYFGFAGGNHAYHIYFSVFAVLTAIFLVIVIYLLKRTQQLSATALPVKSNLQTIVHIIESFMKRYFQFTMGMIPACFVFALLLIYQDHGSIPDAGTIFGAYFKTTGQMFLFLIGYVTLLAAGIYYFTRWYLKRLYGRYVEQLKQCILELEEQD
ncbi:MAG: hypothetical protein HYU71_03730 [Bacteroidetes bacterium]|nr:hypothetical protein [Bacteroidota bacterium]